MKKSLKYRSEIDGLRAVAVIPVIFFHAGFPVFRGGYIGVDIFFVISGYLITSLLLQDLESERFSILKFYERRARRILPALIVVMAFSSIFAWQWMLPYQLVSFGSSLAAVSLFASNVLFYLESGYFSQASELKPLLHTWSLAVEEQFYIVFPPVLYLIYKMQRRWQFTFFSVTGLVILLVAQWYRGQNSQLVFYAAPARAWELLAGVLCAYALRYWTPRSHPVPSMFGLIVLVVCIFTFDREKPLIVAIAVAAVMLVILFGRKGTLTQDILGHRFLVGLGLISYSTYLWHQPLFAFARIRFPQDLGSAVYLILSVAAIAIGYLSWRYVEQPFRVRSGAGFRIPGRSVWLGSFLGLLLFFVTGALTRQGILAPQHFAKLETETAKIAKLKRDVGIFVGDGVCAISPASNWRDWACDPFKNQGPIADLTPVGIAVVGDSYAGDLAATLRSVGLAPFQGSVPGCSIEPGSMNRPCKKFFDHVKVQIAAQPSVREIWLDASYVSREITDVALLRMVNYWRIGDREMFFKTAAPMYPGLENARLLALLHNTPAIPPISWDEADASAAPRVITTLRNAGVQIIDGAAIFCGMAENCAAQLPDGAFLMRDENHLSVLGLQLFAKGLIQKMGCGASPELTQVAGADLDC